MPDIDIAALAAKFLGAGGPRPGGIGHWAIREEAIAEGLGAVRALRGENPAGIAVGATSRRGEAYGNGTFMTRMGSVAVVPVIGPLMARMNWQYWSYDEIIRDIRMAKSDPSISAILLDVDSPGGAVANIDAAISELQAARAVKPVAAHIGGMGCSAAYWLAAAAGEVWAAPTSVVGSVGALIRYLDVEGIFTRLGAKVIESVAVQSPMKRLSPDSPEGKAEMQALVDDAGEMFLAGLERSRGASRETLMADYGQGMVFAASAALARGMVDQVGTFEDILATLADRGFGNSAGSAAARDGQENIMAHEKPGADELSAAATVESLRAAHGGLIASVEMAAAKAERDRILGIEGNSLPGHDALVAEMKADGKTTPAEAAVRVLAAEKVKAATRLAGLAALDEAAAGVKSTPSGDVAKASTPDGWKAEWDSNPALKAEYPTAEAYVAIMKKESGK